MARNMTAQSRELIYELVQKDPTQLGPQLGLISMKYNIPVASYAELLGVSNGAVYHWFYGVSQPSVYMAKSIRKLLVVLRRALLAHEFPLTGSQPDRMLQMNEIIRRHMGDK